MSIFLEHIKKCIDDFNLLISDDNYVSMKTYERFVDKYLDIFKVSKDYVDSKEPLYVQLVGIAQNGYKIVEEKNKKLIDSQLIKYKDYFDKMFLDYDSNILLDNEQRRAILIDEDYSLVVAGAGSGKTTTIVAKVKYLIEIKNVLGSQILLLAFNNKVANELNDILNNYFKLNVEVLTFHKLGMKFIRGIFDKPVQILNNNKVISVLGNHFKSCVFQNKRVLAFHLQYFQNYLRRLNDSEDWKKYSSYEEFYKHYTDNEYLRLKDRLNLEIKQRVKNRSRYFKTINGEFVKSKGEVEIANYLYKHNIPYKYEAPYPYFVGDLRSYSPDFTISFDDKTFYIEFFGLASIDNNGFYDSIDSSYLNEIYLKKSAHAKNETDLIELYGEYEDESYFLQHLAYELAKRNIRSNKKSDKDIFYRLMNTSVDHLYWRLILLFNEFILTYKEMNFDDAVFDELIDSTKDDILKGQLVILKNVYLYYNKTIHDNYWIDFPDMINYAYRYMNYAKNNEKLNYKYIFVDEYQDISQARFNLIKKLSTMFDAKVVAVGDDWQTIYSFSGSDIQLFTHFFDLMGYGEIIKITKTYRNSQELIDIAGEFILQNKLQIEKRLISDKHLDYPIQLVNYVEEVDGDVVTSNFTLIVEKLVLFLYNSNPTDRILLLGRFNSDVDILLDSRKFIYKNKKDGRIICQACPKANLTFLTVHKSKGLGFDQVIILNGLNSIKGFPSKIKDSELMKLLKGFSNADLNNQEMIEYPEERRLFYVALTRTKKYLFIMVPNQFELKSEFVREISEYHNVGNTNFD